MNKTDCASIHKGNLKACPYFSPTHFIQEQELLDLPVVRIGGPPRGWPHFGTAIRIRVIPPAHRDGAALIVVEVPHLNAVHPLSLSSGSCETIDLVSVSQMGFFQFPFPLPLANMSKEPCSVQRKLGLLPFLFARKVLSRQG